MLEVSGLTKTYSGVKALDDVTFQVEKGHVVGFLGANGAGKTTTMDIICGCLGSDSGHVRICGYDIVEQPIFAKQKIGYLPDVPPLYRDMTVTESVVYAARLNGVPRSQVAARVKEGLSLLALDDVQHKLVGSLSKGYRQRVALAHALIHDPEVLILDEPTEGLDPNQIAQIRQIILNLKQSRAVLLSSHILHEVENLCDQLVIIHKGKIEASGDFKAIAAQFQSFSYSLGVRHYVEGIFEKLRGLSYLKNVHETEQQIFHFDVVDPQHLDDLARFVIDEGMGLKKIAPASSSLEGIFQKITS